MSNLPSLFFARYSLTSFSEGEGLVIARFSSNSPCKKTRLFLLFSFFPFLSGPVFLIVVLPRRCLPFRRYGRDRSECLPFPSSFWPRMGRGALFREPYASVGGFPLSSSEAFFAQPKIQHVDVLLIFWRLKKETIFPRLSESMSPLEGERSGVVFFSDDADSESSLPFSPLLVIFSRTGKE